MGFYKTLQKYFWQMVEGKELSQEKLTILSTRTLTAKEAIGDPGRNDYPLMKGKEFMMVADFRGAKGQAFTDMPGNYEGSVRDVLSSDLTDNFQRAIFVATLNAVMRHENLIEHTVHCRDKEPGLCAEKLVTYMKDCYGDPRIALIGYQPAMAASLSRAFALRIVDLDEENIGTERAGVIVDGPAATPAVIDWCDVILSTGSTAVNGTMGKFLNGKPVVFFGVTVAGIAALCGFDRYCPYGH